MKIIEIFNDFLPEERRNEAGFLSALAGLASKALPFIKKAAPAALSIGSGLLGGLFGGGDDENEPEFKQTPEFAESQAAKALWFQKLQEFGGQPGYGAVSPDYANIWEQAKKRVKQFYRGSATSPGLTSRVRASAARRNVSDSPALEAELSRLGAEEGSQLSDIATQQAISQAQFGETGRQDWLSNLSQLAGLSPGGQFYTPQQTGGIGNLLADVGSAAGNYLQTKQNRDWYEKLLEKQYGQNQPAVYS